MFIDFALVGLVAALMIPTLSGYYAYTHGRSFWLWFAFGLLLPVISYIILLLLPDKTNNTEVEFQKLRLELGLLGTKSEFPIQDKTLQKALRKPKKHINFELNITPDYTETRIFIDGTDLKEILFLQELRYASREGNSRLAGNYRGIMPENLYLPSNYLLGNPTNRNAKTVLYTDKATGEKELWAFVVRIEEYTTCIVWRGFANLARQGKWKYDKLGIFVFNKLQYLSALENLEKKAKQLNL